MHPLLAWYYHYREWVDIITFTLKKLFIEIQGTLVLPIRDILYMGTLCGSLVLELSLPPEGSVRFLDNN